MKRRNRLFGIVAGTVRVAPRDLRPAAWPSFGDDWITIIDDPIPSKG